MKDFKREYRGSFSGWWLVLAAVLLILASWDSDAQQWEPEEVAQEIHRLKQAGKLDTRWIVTYMPWGLGSFSIRVGTRSQELSQCVAQGMRFLGLRYPPEGVRPKFQFDHTEARFLCEKECIDAQDGGGHPQCLWMELYDLQGRKLAPQ